jgi:hypothetical protein
MRLSARHRQRHDHKAPRVSISQAEITADLLYPAVARPAAPAKRRRPHR